MTGIQVEEAKPTGRWWIKPGEVRYIKLGPGGAWVDRCLEERVIAFGHHGVPHALAAEADWVAVRQHFLDDGLSPSKASDFTQELRDFYTLPASTLWITIARGRLWWTFAEAEVTPTEEPGFGARLRRCSGGWRSVDVTGAPLDLSDLSTRLTRVAAYRQTLCQVEASDYLIRRINDEPEPSVAQAVAARETLTQAVQTLISGLH